VIGTALVSATAIGVNVFVVRLALEQHDPALDRVLLLVAYAVSPVWRWTPAVLVVSAAVLSVLSVAGKPSGDGRSGTSLGRRALRGLFPRPVRAPVLVAVLTGTLIATITTQIMLPGLSNDNDTFLLGSLRQWICAVTGAATVAVLLVTTRRPASSDESAAEVTSAHLVLSGAITTISAGLLQFTRDAVDPANDSGRNLGNLVQFLQIPLWLLVVLIVVLGPFVLLGAELARYRLPVGLRPRPRAALVAGAVAVMALPVGTGLAAPVTASHGDARALQRLLGGTGTDRPPEAPDPGRPFSPWEARTLLRQVQTTTLSKWTPIANDPVSAPAGIRPAHCQARFAADHRAEAAGRKSADETRTFIVPAAELPPAGAKLVVSLTSYADAAAATAAFDSWRVESQQCPTFSIADPGSGHARATTLAPDGTLDEPYPTRMYLVTSTQRDGSARTVASVAAGLMLVDHNLIGVTVSYVYVAPRTATVAEIIRLTRAHCRTALLAASAALDQSS
jgi:hypothetical protein